MIWLIGWKGHGLVHLRPHCFFFRTTKTTEPDDGVERIDKNTRTESRGKVEWLFGAIRFFLFLDDGCFNDSKNGLQQ